MTICNRLIEESWVRKKEKLYKPKVFWKKKYTARFAGPEDKGLTHTNEKEIDLADR